MSQQYLPFTVLKRQVPAHIVSALTSRNSTYRLRYWNSSIISSALLEYFVATVLTVYGIETQELLNNFLEFNKGSQQYLPFTVLKPSLTSCFIVVCLAVATVLTVYGIETVLNIDLKKALLKSRNSTYRLRYWNC